MRVSYFDPTKTSTHDFFEARGMNLVDVEVVAYALGNFCEPAFLDGLTALIDHGCHRNTTGLRTAIRDYVVQPGEELNITAPFIRILAAGRTLDVVPTTVAVQEYCGYRAPAELLEQLLGENVPAWLFPAICVVARRTGAFEFADQLTGLLTLWGYSQAKEVAELIEFYRPTLEAKATDAEWMVPVPVSN
jgi:hypothetical protein